MWRAAGRALWWVIAYDRPSWRGDYAAMLALLGLLLLGALALSWPWLAEEVPRAMGAGWSLLRSGFAALVEWLASILRRFG